MDNIEIAVVGLGYVGLPLAVEFGKIIPTVGFDISMRRVDELKKGFDKTLEINKEEIEEAKFLIFTNKTDDLKNAYIFIITVPTPIDKKKKPDLNPLLKASTTVGEVLKKGDIVIYESTVYPGCTEEDCVPVLEKMSGLTYNIDFFCGYSPERIVPGDKERTLTKIKKITSGSTEEIADKIDQLYKQIIVAGTYKAPSIKVAEAAKVIENCQRDLNISFVNELALIFDRMGIDTTEVLEAAGTKFNFLPFKPGLVGGHCIGVDPYYLTTKAEMLGYQPQVIHSGRKINDDMGRFVATKVIKLLNKKDHKIKGSRILILGITFKENCPDIRNTKIVYIYYELLDYGVLVDVWDPWADSLSVFNEYGINIIKDKPSIVGTQYDAVILACAHNEFKGLNFKTFTHNNSVIYDTKSVLPKSMVDGRL